MLIVMLALLAGCAGPPRSGGWWNALEIAGRAPLRAEEVMRVTALTETAERTVNVVQVRGTVKSHRHRRSDETVTLLRGSGAFALGGQSRKAGPGDVIFIPRGTPHSYSHEGEGESILVSVFTPRFRPGDRVFAP